MKHVKSIRRIAAVLAGFGAALLTLTAAAPAFAMRMPPTGDGAYGSVPRQTIAVTRTVVVGGMPGWQIALIAVAAALFAATLAVIAERARTAHRKAVMAAA